MFKNGTKVTLTLREDKPADSSNYESNALYNKGFYASQNTAMNIRHRILALYASSEDAKQTLVNILKEIEDEENIPPR
jgi:hypothetical protein